jgi:hypothetical protein
MITKTAKVNLVRYGLSLGSDNTQEGKDAAAAVIKMAELVEQGHTIADIVAASVPPEQQLAVIDDLYKVAFSIDEPVKTAQANAASGNVKMAARLTRYGFKYAAANTKEGVDAAATVIKIASAVEQGASIAEAVVNNVLPEHQVAVIDELYKAAAPTVEPAATSQKKN